jgi:hypothetical protein
MSLDRQMMSPRLFAALATALLIFAAPAAAADYPDIVRKAIDDARGQCIAAGGTPGEASGASVDDLDGNGGEDWILDYSKHICGGVLPQFCGSAGCALKIFMWQSGSRWDLVFDHNVEAWKRRTFGRKPGLSVSFHGSVCNQPGMKRCLKKYVFENGKLRPI